MLILKKIKDLFLTKINLNNFLNNNLDKFKEKLEPVYDAVKKTKKNLDQKKSLISFIGAPWTLIVYMLGLKKDKNQQACTKLLENEKEIKIILPCNLFYLCAHITVESRS